MINKKSVWILGFIFLIVISVGFVFAECNDSDGSGEGSKNYYNKGSITGPLVSNANSIREDTCLDNKLRELFCNSEGKGEPLIYECPNGCRDGACILNKCIDSDNGKDYYTRGEVVISSSGEKVIDACVKGGPTDGSLREFYCDNNSLMVEQHFCSEGEICINGACEKTWGMKKLEELEKEGISANLTNVGELDARNEIDKCEIVEKAGSIHLVSYTPSYTVNEGDFQVTYSGSAEIEFTINDYIGSRLIGIFTPMKLETIPISAEVITSNMTHTHVNPRTGESLFTMTQIMEDNYAFIILDTFNGIGILPYTKNISIQIPTNEKFRILFSLKSKRFTDIFNGKCIRSDLGVLEFCADKPEELCISEYSK